MNEIINTDHHCVFQYCIVICITTIFKHIWTGVTLEFSGWTFFVLISGSVVMTRLHHSTLLTYKQHTSTDKHGDAITDSPQLSNRSMWQWYRLTVSLFHCMHHASTTFIHSSPSTITTSPPQPPPVVVLFNQPNFHSRLGQVPESLPEGLQVWEFIQAGYAACHSTNSVKQLKG